MIGLRPPRGPALFLVLFLFLLQLLACKPQGEASSPVLLRVGDRSVTLEEFRRSFAKTLDPEQNLSPEEKSDLERSFLVQVIDRELALAEAGRQGIAVTPAEVEAALQEHRRDYPAGAFEEMLRERRITLEEWRRELEEGLLLEKAARQAVGAGAEVTAAAIAAHYQEHREEFDRPAQVRARQIVVASEEEGKQVLALLRGGEPFAEAARRHSLSPDAEQGGDLGFFARGEMPAEFEAVVFSLPVGRTSDLVRSEYGYHIFLVEERREALRLTLEQAQEEVRDRLRRQREEQAYQEWLQGLRAQARIEVDWSLL